MFVLMVVMTACKEDIAELGAPPKQEDAAFEFTPSTTSNNVLEFTSPSSAFLKKWDFGNGQTGEGNTVTIDHYRKKTKHVSPLDIDWESSPPNFNECVSSTIAELIPALPDKYRIPLEMTEMQNLSQLEVAEKLNLNYATAKARIQRARQMLKDKIDEVLIVKTDGYGNVVLCKNRTPCCN